MFELKSSAEYGRNRRYRKSFLIVFTLSFFLLNAFVVPFPASGPEKGNILNDIHLKGYLEYSALNSPKLKSAFNKWKAGLKRVAQVKSLPDPNFTFAYFIKEVETKVGPQQMKSGIMQKFPWFGKLKLRGKKAFELAEALRENFEKEKLNLFYKVKKVYYDYYYVKRSVEIIDENITLLKAANEQMNSMYSTGIASYSNLIRLQVELDKLKDREDSLREKLPSIRVAFNSILNRSPGEEIIVQNRIKDITFGIDGKNLREVLKANNPELKKLDHIILGMSSGVKLSKKNYYPDLSIGADLILTGDSPIPGIAENGKDPFIVKMGFNLPIGHKRIKASIKEAEFRLDSAKNDREEALNILISDLESALFNFNDSRRKVKLYRDSLIPKALQAFNVTRTAFSTGSSGFLDFIDTQRTLLEFELKMEKAKTSHLQNLALIEKITGKNLKTDIEKSIQE